METWEVELATDFWGSNTVYKSKSLGTNDSITINANFGTFTGSLKGNLHLTTGTYFCRVRQKRIDGLWSGWSRWHQPFYVAEN